jgi:hypothetical protein
MSSIFQGVATSEVFLPQQMDAFIERFGCKPLNFISEITFAESSKEINRKEFIDILFTGQGTLILANASFSQQHLDVVKQSAGQKSLIFSIFQYDQTAYLHFYINGQVALIFFEPGIGMRYIQPQQAVVPAGTGLEVAFTLIQDITGLHLMQIPPQTVRAG